MNSIKATTHAFIVRIWIEPREMKDAEPIWRGVIEHVEGEERVYFNDLDLMRNYFAEHLAKIGIRKVISKDEHECQ